MRLPVDCQKASSSGRQSPTSAPLVEGCGTTVPGEMVLIGCPPCCALRDSLRERPGGSWGPRGVCVDQRAKEREKGAAGALRPISSVLRTSVQYIQISETQTTPYRSMKADERTPVRSISAPNMMGSTKPPRPPASPTTPLTVPMLCG